jgi:hypothetical protein
MDVWKSRMGVIHGYPPGTRRESSKLLFRAYRIQKYNSDKCDIAIDIFATRSESQKLMREDLLFNHGATR